MGDCDIMEIEIIRDQDEEIDINGEPETMDLRNQLDRQCIVDKALATHHQDNFNLLSQIKLRLDRVGVELAKTEVRFENLKVGANVQVGSRSLPTLFNFVYDVIENVLTSLRIINSKRYSLTILNEISGIVKPGRMTLLLGPPGSGKSTLLRALAGKLDGNLKKNGRISYNGHNIDEFCVQRTCGYVSQSDNHLADLTVREAFDFAARCQASSQPFQGYIKELAPLEKENKIIPNPHIDAFMKAASTGGKEHSILTDYVLKILGLDVCSETIVGDDMVRGISGGQRKRVTTGEMVVGPRKILLMDEISTGLDSSTTYQIVKCIGNFVHEMEATVLMALLQPPPETFQLFDDIVLLSDGYLVYQGPRQHVLDFFESLGFQLPPRKGIADFLQEVTSKKDQKQYWADHSRPYTFVSAFEFAEAFKNSKYGKSLELELNHSYNKSQSHPSALAKTKFATSKWELFRACFAREWLLITRNKFLYIFRTCQVSFVGFVTCTMFLSTRTHPRDENSGNLYLGCLFYGLIHMMFNGFSELPLMISRLPVFYKERDNLFYPAWAWSTSSWILRLPYSVLEAFVWSCIVYYTVGFAPSAVRFFQFMLLLFSVHQMALGLFRTMASITRDMVVANTFGSAALLIIFLLGGFIVPKGMINPWWSWAYWMSPLTYGQRAISVNEFTATKWMEKSTLLLGNNNETIGYSILHSLGIPSSNYWYWLGVGALFIYAFLFNAVITLALAYLHPLRKAQTIIPLDDANCCESSKESKTTKKKEKGMILPFKPLTMTFHNVNYFVDIPKEMKQKGEENKNKLQLLSNVSGVFCPGVLTALVGASGAGKTTLMDVLVGRKTGGYIEGDIRISGYPKQQSSFARISGYVEQNDIHSPQLTVEESLHFSSSLRLPSDLTKQTRNEFVEEVMSLVELDSVKHALVGIPGTTGLSTEQRKRLTIAVELVANPSIIFMDEPTSGLDARAAAIVMRAVRNTVDTGRTVVCTIHQPSIDIFEAFDELLLMKRGGKVIYGGKLGKHSQIMIDYFEGINGVTPIPKSYNPATWMLEITTAASEERIGKDFAEIYINSTQYRNVEDCIEHYSVPAEGEEKLKFDSTYARDRLNQFMSCLWKQFIVYWRSPHYNAMRLIFTFIGALIFGSVFWNIGIKRNSTQELSVVMGALYAACLFLGVNNAASVQPIVSIERTVFYREKAAGMYSPIVYALTQGLVEIPYIGAQTIIFGVITYYMVNFERTLGKFVLYLLFMFLTFTYFTCYGMMAVGLTSTQHMASIVSSAFYSLWNLFSGFLVPKPSIPGWWIWLYYLCPVSWTLRGIISSQLGDVESMIIGGGFEGTVKEFLEQRLGYEDGMIGVSISVLFAFIFLFFSIFATSLKFINFQTR